jgi:hypothetical protein
MHNKKIRAIILLIYELFYFSFGIINENVLQALPNQLKFLIAKHYSTAGVDIYNLPEGSVLDANQHDVI